jgi:hypothetical protein
MWLAAALLESTVTVRAESPHPFLLLIYPLQQRWAAPKSNGPSRQRNANPAHDRMPP